MRSVGAIERRGSFWIISCAPACMIALKRNFVRIDKASDSEVRLRSTPEVDADIQWFREKWPLDIEPKDERLLHHGAETHRGRQRMVEEIEAGTYVPRDFAMAKPPREYQKIAADLCLRNGSLLVGDQVGLGKSVTTMCLFTDPRTLPAVVVTISAGMADQWVRMMGEFLPDLRAHALTAATPYDIPARCQELAARARREAIREGRPLPPEWPRGVQPDVIVLPYSRLVGWMDVLKGRTTTIAFDEIQELRHSDTQKYRAAMAIRSRATFCMGLSGTPVHGYGGQFYNVVEMVRPGALGERDEFHREWCVDVGEERKVRLADPVAFGHYLRTSGVMVRRTRKDVGRELPPVTTIPMPVDTDTAVFDKVKGRAHEMARIILGHNPGTNFEKLRAGGELDKIVRQATGIAKSPAVAALIRLLVEQDGPIIVAAWHRAVYDIFKAELADMNPVFYTGAESERQKRDALAAFLGGRTKVFIMSLRAGAGLDGLQHVCSQCVIAELDWVPQVHDQFIGRIARDGQKKPVFAYFPLADDGSDPVVGDVCGMKRANSEPVMDTDQTHSDQVQVDPEHVKRLARAYLDSHR